MAVLKKEFIALYAPEIYIDYALTEKTRFGLWKKFGMKVRKSKTAFYSGFDSDRTLVSTLDLSNPIVQYM